MRIVCFIDKDGSVGTCANFDAEGDCKNCSFYQKYEGRESEEFSYVCWKGELDKESIETKDSQDIYIKIAKKILEIFYDSELDYQLAGVSEYNDNACVDWWALYDEKEVIEKIARYLEETLSIRRRYDG